MKKITVLLPVLTIFLLTAPGRVPAEPISKNSVILKEVREVKTAEDVVFAKESIYVGGISGNRPAQDLSGQEGEVTLREYRATNSALTLSGGLKIEVKVIPTVARKSQSGDWSPALGKWDFKYGETNNYKSVIHVQMGGDLDIAYQSSGMEIGEEANVMHFGLTGNPHAVILSKRRLKKAFQKEEFIRKTKPILSYQPPNDVILVQMDVTSQGINFRPIFDFQVVKPQAVLY